MPAILPSIKLDSEASLSKHLMPHQIHWCLAEEHIHSTGAQAFALAEKSVRIGFTYADIFKNVRKRILHRKRDYLFASKDLPSALEYARHAVEVTALFDLTRAIVAHGEEYLKVPRLDSLGRPTAFTDEIKVGSIKYDNGSRIITFSSNPQAMAVYGGDVGLDEFAKHPNAELLFETAQGRVAWGYDLAIWSAHDGENTLFNQFAREASLSAGPWNLYYRITMPDAIELGLLDCINKSRGTAFTPDKFIADCRARARSEAVFQQAYMCNPIGATSDAITDWSVIERCRADYPFERLHLEAQQVADLFGDITPGSLTDRAASIHQFLLARFPQIFTSPASFRLGFDVAASGQGHLAAIYVDEVKGPELWLRALFTCRTEDWHFLSVTLSTFLRDLHAVHAAGDESGLGRQICWEMSRLFPGRFTPVNFASKKHDLGFALMNQLSHSQKRFPSGDHDIAADFFALRKAFVGQRWVFSEARNQLNPASHCDIAWAGALATHAHLANKSTIGARVG